MTSPLERSILTHYFCHPFPWKNGSEHWTHLECQIVDKFIEAGLLLDGKRDGHPCVLPNTTALEIYMEALSQVPLPKLIWVIPKALGDK